jgi:hypothetical protein
LDQISASGNSEGISLFAAGKCRSNRVQMIVALEIVGPRQNPNVIEILHAAIGAAKVVTAV